MIINKGNLALIFTGYKASFTKGMTNAQSFWEQVAMRIPSATGEEVYGWLGQLPSLREWIGPRILKSLAAKGYTIPNKDFEATITVPRNSIEDDKYGLFSPLFEEMGRSAAAHPDELVFSALKAGFTSECYDGQNFFDTDHPVGTKEAGTLASVSNVQNGAGPAWFLLDTNRVMKPMIYQERRPYSLVSKTEPTDDNVFFNKEYIYGVDSRGAVGFGLWQLAFASKAELNSTNFNLARTAMMELKGDEGKPLGISPTVLVVPPSLDEAARKLINGELIDNGSSNPWVGSAKIICTPWVM